MRHIQRFRDLNIFLKIISLNDLHKVNLVFSFFPVGGVTLSRSALCIFPPILELFFVGKPKSESEG